MSEEKKGGLFSNLQESIFSKPLKQKGIYEKTDAADDTAEDAVSPPAEPSSAAKPDNPFATGTDHLSANDSENMQNVAPSSEKTENRDARVLVQIDVTQLSAEILVEAPSGEGQPLSKEMLSEAIAKAGISFGIKEEGLEELLKPTYDKSIVIARGIPPRDGQDGVCKELYPRTMEATVLENEDGTVDYKELGLITDLPAGTVICEVYPPSEGMPGTSVQGKTLKPRSGQRAVPPIGEGTRLSPDGKKVETTVGGNLVFRNGHFTVDTVYRVQDIDYDVGNIAFSGDVQVNGDMADGFEIHSGGNIFLHGRVGNVVLEAKGNITIEKGINGTGKAEVTAGKSIEAGFIENSIVRAGENITSGSIINSTVECEGDILVTEKHGIICGGKVTALGSVKAKVIGNESNTPTNITVGITPSLLKERKKYVDQLTDVTKHIDEMQKNTVYIEKMIAQEREIPQERIQLLQRTKLTLPITEKKREQLTAAIKEIEDKMNASGNSTVSAKTLYPPTRINIGTLNISCTETRYNTTVYMNKEGDLVFGNL
ncbi:FapA family protein [Ruminococcaceae bacterium OttesenSCG-928-I18]|nr:FapA family protein [Ruminococcaceae bacterium OttesenSCG-928-I18]